MFLHYLLMKLDVTWWCKSYGVGLAA